MAWRETTIGDLVDFFDSKRVPLNSRQRAERQGIYPYYGASGVVDHIDGYIFDGRYLLVAEDGENLNSRKLPIAFFAKGKFWVNNHAHIIKGKPKVADDEFLKHWFAWANISAYVTGAAQPKLSQSNLKRMSIRLPDFAEQQQIASILSAYDNLIENNTRRIEILEEMARRLYEEWFVHFRFPGHEEVSFKESELGEIPEGWEVVKLSEVSEYISRGISPKYAESDCRVINQKCIRDNRLNMALSREQIKKVPEAKYVRFGDVLINSTGVGTLGRVAQVYESLENVTVDSHVTIVRPLPEIDFDFFGIELQILQPYFEGLGVGATGQTELSRVRVGETPVAIPPAELQKKFGELVGPMRRACIKYGVKNTNLRAQRDLLLPKLVSGEIDVSDIPMPDDKEVEAA